MCWVGSTAALWLWDPWRHFEVGMQTFCAGGVSSVFKMVVGGISIYKVHGVSGSTRGASGKKTGIFSRAFSKKCTQHREICC